MELRETVLNAPCRLEISRALVSVVVAIDEVAGDGSLARRGFAFKSVNRNLDATGDEVIDIDVSHCDVVSDVRPRCLRTKKHMLIITTVSHIVEQIKITFF